MTWLRVVVLGGSGFVGAAVMRSAKRLGAKAVSVGKPRGEDPHRSVVATVVDYEPQLVIHAASSLPIDEEGLLLAELARVGIRTMIIGSAAVLAGSPPDVGDRHSEKAAPHPISGYGEFKLWQEGLALELRSRGWDVAVARLFNPIGPGMKAHLMLGRLVREIVEREQNPEIPPQIEVGSLSAIRDFMHVDDAADALLATSRLPEMPPLIHIASGRGVSVGDIARSAVAMSTRGDLELRETLTAASASAAATRVVGDVALLRRLAGWEPARSLRAAVAEALSAERARGEEGEL